MYAGRDLFMMGDGMSAEALRLFADLSITYYPPNKQRSREPLATCCDKFVGRLIGQHGLPHVTLVLRAIAESEGNGNALISDVIGAVSDIVLSHPRWPAMGLAFIEALDHVNLFDVRKTAKAANVHPLRVGVATLIAIELAKILGPSRPPRAKPPKPVKVKLPPKPPLALTRIPQIERAIALGKDLLSLRASIACNKQFGRERRRRFPDVDSITAARTMRVARLYAGRPEIWRAASWRTLIELASPKMAPSMRQALEAKILAGETITAPHIRKTRGRFKGGSPKRPINQPAARMAA
jgi:hypothetical protein